MLLQSFDQILDRGHTQSIRWDKYGPEVIPLWVADMDFKAPDCVLESLHERINHGVFGYTYASSALKESIVAYVQSNYAWKIDASWIHFLPSVVTGLHLSVRTLTQADDHVLIPEPAYHHFKELEQLAKFAQEHRLIICSDEIHADLILDENVGHIPIGSLSDEIAQHSFSLMSLNKTFNFPGLGLAWVICPNSDLSQQLLKDIQTLIPHPNLFAYEATQAALDHGKEWRQALIHYLRSNRDFVMQRINAMPGLSMAHLQATYLAWIDVHQKQWANPFEQFLQAGVALSPGSQFGAPQFVRLNFGTQRSILEKALDRMESICRSS